MADHPNSAASKRRSAAGADRPGRKRSRALTAPLSRERIVDAALALIGDSGLDAFSTRKLGERLGCEAMSIYHQFPSKQHLLDALVEHAIGTGEIPEPGPDSQARVRAMLHSYRAMARRSPQLFPLVALHRLNTPAGVRSHRVGPAPHPRSAPGHEQAARMLPRDRVTTDRRGWKRHPATRGRPRRRRAVVPRPSAHRRALSRPDRRRVHRTIDPVTVDPALLAAGMASPSASTRR